MALFKKIGNLFVPEKSAKRNTYNALLQRNVNPYEQWTVESELGDGSFGKVYRAVNKESGVQAALKEVPIESDEDLDDHMIELSILHECKHKNIVALYEAYIYDEKIMMLLEYCGGGAVDNIMIELDKPLTEPQIRYTCHEICEGLAFLHKSFVIHRDIKAGNVLLTLNGMVKLADFGVSTKDNRAGIKHTTFIGTPYWMAPEVAICDAVKDEPYDCRADIWSLGVTLIELAETQPPHHEMSPMRVIMRILKSEPPTLQRPSSWSPDFATFLSHCLMKNPDDRWPISDLLSHPFVKDATDPQPILLLLAEFRADVCETQEEITDPEVIKRFSQHGGLVDNIEPAIAELPEPEPENEQQLSMDDSASPISFEKPPSDGELVTVTLPFQPKLQPEVKESQSAVFVIKSPSPVDPSMAEISTLEEVVDRLLLDVISDDVKSPSIPECVAAAISEYVAEQCLSKLANASKTPVPQSIHPNVTQMMPKSAPEPKTTGAAPKKQQTSAVITITPQRRLPRTTYMPVQEESKIHPEGTDLEISSSSPVPQRLSVAEMAKVLSVKLGHSSESDERSPQKGLTRSTIPPSPAHTSSNNNNNRQPFPSSAQPIYADANGNVQDMCEVVAPTKKQPPPLPPRHQFTSPYPEEANLSATSANPPRAAEQTVSPISSEVVPATQKDIRVQNLDNPESAPTAQHGDGRDTIERSASRYRTLVRVRRFEFGGKTVTTSTSHLIVTNGAENSTVVDRSKAIARERRRHLRELKVLQRAENKAYQEMLTKSNLELDQQAKRIESERDAILARYENEEEVLRQQQKQNLEAVERLQAREMKTLVKRLNEQQEREFRTLRENGKDELKALEREIGRLPKELRKQTLRIKTTMKQDELARREAEFAKRQEEKMQLEKRTLAESHRGDLLRLEQQFLEQQQHIRRKQEAEMAQLEERQVHEKHALSQRHILTAYKLKQQQMSTRHLRELTRLKTEADRSASDLKQSQGAELKLVPRKIREESKVRLQMYKEKLRIESKKSGISDMRLGFMSLVGDSNREKIREFEMEEKRRKEEYQDRVERRHRVALAKLEAENEILMKDTESAHGEALRQLADAEATKLNELDREFQEELLRCHNMHVAAQAELEARFREELEDQRRFYHVPLNSTSSSPNSAGAVGVSIRSSKSSYGATGFSNDDSLSTGTASSSENHQQQQQQQQQQRMYHSQTNGTSHNNSNGGLPRSTLVASDYEIALAARSREANGISQMTTSAIAMQQSLDRQMGQMGQKSHAIYTSEML